jgi:HAD superfamily hydrolase (TIGR01549 family)
MIKLIVFDWDDVIVLGAKNGYFACYHKAVEGVGVHLTPEEEKKRILAKWSKPYREELKELLKEKPELVDQACTIFEKEYWGDTFTSELSLVPGVVELLTKLSKTYKLAVATGKHPKMLKEHEIPHFKIPQVFSHIISSHDISDVEKMKPHPYMLEKIMKDTGVLPVETIFVGDAATDVQMAIAARVVPVVVLTGHLHKDEAVHMGVQHIIDSVIQLPSLLQLLR